MPLLHILTLLWISLLSTQKTKNKKRFHLEWRFAAAPLCCLLGTSFYPAVNIIEETPCSHSSSQVYTTVLTLPLSHLVSKIPIVYLSIFFFWVSFLGGVVCLLKLMVIRFDCVYEMLRTFVFGWRIWKIHRNSQMIGIYFTSLLFKILSFIISWFGYKIYAQRNSDHPFYLVLLPPIPYW